MNPTNNLNRLSASILTALLAVQALPAWALPQGDSVRAGTATIATSGSDMNITGSGNVAIDWTSFGINSGESVTFNGMNAALNYVTGSDPSDISGNLNGNGVAVYLVNPNGISINNGATINVGSLTLSTRSLDDSTRSGFAGNLPNRLDRLALQKDVVNLGTLTANSLTVEGKRVILGADTLKGMNGGNTDLNGKLSVTTAADDSIKNQDLIIRQEVNVPTITVQGNAAKDYANAAAQDRFTGITLNGTAGKEVKSSYPVDTLYDLQNLNAKRSANYYLTQDIDASATANWNGGEGFQPIGDWSSAFSGIFDGTGYKISNFTINRPNTNAVGLFGFSLDGTVQNIGVDGASVQGEYNTGGLVGKNLGNISKAYFTGSITGINFVGGLVGWNDGDISNAYVTSNVIGSGYHAKTGGLVGLNIGSISNVYATGSITGSDSESSDTGGLVGVNDGDISNAYATGNVTGGNGSYSDTGGLVGWNSGSIKNVYATGKVAGARGSSSDTGGLAGWNSGSISNAYATGVVISNNSNEPGGLVGYDNNHSGITNGYQAVYQSGSISGYKKYRADDSTQVDVAAFNTAFKNGGAADTDWTFYTDRTPTLGATSTTPTTPPTVTPPTVTPPTVTPTPVTPTPTPSPTPTPTPVTPASTPAPSPSDSQANAWQQVVAATQQQSADEQEKVALAKPVLLTRENPPVRLDDCLSNDQRPQCLRHRVGQP